MIIYLIRHSGPFVEFENEEKLTWDEFNSNMILSVSGEEKAKKLCKIKELKGIKNIYSSLSSRAIATAKYVAEQNNVKIKLDKRINERVFGIEYLNQLPEGFVLNQFKDKTLKLKGGESLSEVSARFNAFIRELVEKNEDCILFVHGVLLLNYLSEITIFSFDGKVVNASFNNKVVVDRKLNNPDVFKIIFENEKIVDVQNILL